MIKIVPSGDSIIIIKDLNDLKSSTLTNYLINLDLNEIEDVISLKNSVGIIFNPYKIASSSIFVNFLNFPSLNLPKETFIILILFKNFTL